MATKKPRAPYLNEPVELNFDALDQFMATLPQQQAPVEKSSMVRRALGDTGIAALKGVIGWPEALVGMADLVSGGQAGKLAEEAGFRPKEAKAILDEYLSPEQQAANQAVQQAEGFVGKGVAAITNPSVIWQNAVESAPSMLGGGVIARGALAAVPRMSPIVAAGIGEGAVTAGQNVEQVRQETPDGLLTPTQSGVVAASGALTGGIGIVAGKIAKSLGIGDVDVLLTGVAKASPQVQKGFVRRVLEGALTEGVLEELPQSTQEQVAQNLALGKPLDEGVDHAAVLGMLAGGLMGAVAGPMGTPQGNAIRDERLPEVGPLTKALNTATEQRAQMADAGKSVTPDQATVSAKARIDELGKKEAGTPDEELPGPNGEPVTVSGTPPQILSAGETQEKQFLEANKDNPAVLAGAKGKVVSPIPGAIDADVALERMRDQLRTDEAIVKAREREADAAHAATLQPQPEPESDAAPAPEPTDILSPSGGPWKAKLAAQKALKSRPDKADLALASVAGGYVLRRKPDAQQPDVHESPPVAAVADAGGSDQPAGGGGPVGPVAADATGGSAPAAAAPAPSSGEAELLADGGAAPDGAVRGEPIDAEWSAFTPESGTKGVPRAEMPQIKAEHRGALTQFMLGRGIEHTQAEVNAADLKPTQQEFSPAKVDKAREFVGEDRAILVSNDGYVLDGHHQWLAKRDEGLPIRVIAFNAPIDQLVDEAKQFPSAEQAEGATDAQAVRSDEGQVRSGEPSQGTAIEGGLRPGAEQGRGDLQQPAPDQTGEHGRQAEVAPTEATRSSEQAEAAAATEAKPERAADNREDAGSTVPAGSPESAQSRSDATLQTVMGMTDEQRRAAIDAESMETRHDAPQVAQPTKGKRVRVIARTLNGIKQVTANLYELPNYNGPQLAVSEYKSSRGHGYRVYLPKSGAFITDSNGVSSLDDTLKLAVLRIHNARQTIASRAPAAEREQSLKTRTEKARAARAAKLAAEQAAKEAAAEAAKPTPEQTARRTEMVELRKRLSVLEQLRKCL